MGPLFDRDREVIQMHLGGGTPNFLRPAELRELIESVGSRFRLSTHALRDFSIELDPRWIEPAHIATYAELGFNRVSLGVQDFDADVQRAVNRIQTVEQTLSVIDACRARHFRSINIDLIYGLPQQTPEGFERTLESVLAVRPERLAIYSYAHLPELFKAQRQIDTADLPGPEVKLGLLRLAVEKLASAGYQYIGMDHFALPEDDLASAQAAGTLQRNFMGYTTHADCDLLGLGVSAISHIGDSFSQNARDIAAWERTIDQGQPPVWRGRHLDSDDLARGDVIQQLMCHGRIGMAAIETRHRINFRTYFADALVRLQHLAAGGLVTVSEREIAATPRGRLLLRIIAMCFDRYLAESSSPVAAPRFSKVI
jgi:oxygen-independent coproporphyrinogen III oxidase